jgi:hypothetical protein
MTPPLARSHPLVASVLPELLSRAGALRAVIRAMTSRCGWAGTTWRRRHCGGALSEVQAAQVQEQAARLAELIAEGTGGA